MQIVPVYMDRLVDEGPVCLRDIRAMDAATRATAFAQILGEWDPTLDPERIPDTFDMGRPGDPYAIAFGIIDQAAPLVLLGAGLVHKVHLLAYDHARSTASVEGDMLVASSDQAIRDRLYEVGAEGFSMTTVGNPATVAVKVVGGFPP